jgi:GTP diphosphokinase / guanosine-3',5'-bis(diphosphate) 3'-diphosphatase
MATVRQSAPEASPKTAPATAAGVAKQASAAASTPHSLAPEELEGINQRFEEMVARVQANRPNEDVSLIRRAWDFCVQHHLDQRRASGEPYIIHPLKVAEILAEMKMDATAISAGLLHDAVEDTPATSDEIAVRFGDQVAHIVEGVTKIDKIQFANREDRQAENVRKMLLAMVEDVRVVLIKLADRLHNMRTLQHLKPERQEAIARETMDIYAPLAHRLGMGKVRGELEDLAFRYTDPVAYEQVSAAVEARRADGEQFMRTVEDAIVDQLRENGIEARVEWRIKRLYSIYQKLERQKISFDQVYDFLAIRIITQDVSACYAVFGMIHTLWPPVPGRIKDFIAIPRANHYRSLHTTVMGEGGLQFEVQIRTEEMHRIAEEGIAAHWKYKAGGENAMTARDEERLNWIRQLVEWQKEMTDPNEFLSSLKMDLYPDEVYTFTPKGKVVVVPAGSTPIDFAYTIHTEVGHTCVGAKVNGRMVPLRTKLKTGDIVSIVTQKEHKPSRDWLTFVKSPRARNKIKHWLNEDQRRRAVEIGRKLLDREARKYKVPLSLITDQDLSRLAGEYGVATASDLLAALGLGKNSAHQVLVKLAPGCDAQADPEPEIKPSAEAQAMESERKLRLTGNDSLKVEGQNDLLVYRARCCNPIRGEEIVGYVTRGKGVAVHARNCPNVQNLLYEADRRIAVEWSAAPASAAGRVQRYPVKVIVYCDDRTGMLKELTAVISDENTNIRSVEVTRPDNGEAAIEFVIEAEDLRQLKRLVLGLRRVKGVRVVQRTQKV